MRTVVHILAVIATGVLLSFATAALCAVNSDTSLSFEERALRWQSDVPPLWPRHPTSQVIMSGRGYRQVVSDDGLSLLQADTFATLAQQTMHRETVVQAGWPILCFRARHHALGYPTSLPADTVEANFAIPSGVVLGDIGHALAGPRRIPLQPDMLPLFLNSLIITSPAILIVVAFGALRHRVSRRGVVKCKKCGYDTRDLPRPRCPECGSVLPR